MWWALRMHCVWSAGRGRYKDTMTSLPNFASPEAQIPAVQELLKAAQRLETPCGNGVMVWHAWKPEQRLTADTGLPPLVLFHGGSGSWTHWLANIGALVRSGREVYVPDLPGFGDSAAPLHGSDADALPQPVEDGLQMLLGDRRCDIVAFSFGSMVAGFIAEQFPARVAQLVLVGAPGLGIAPQPLLQLRSWRHLTDTAARDAVHRHNLGVLMLYRPEAITETALRLHVANVERDRMKGRSLARTDVLLKTLASVHCPVSAIYGAEDVLYRGRMAELAGALQKAPDFRGLKLLENVGHWVQYEQPDAFNTALLSALSAGRDGPTKSRHDAAGAGSLIIAE